MYLTFILGSEVFAVAIRSIREIIEYSVPTPVPLASQHVRGVIDLRGAVVPVANLSGLLRRPASPVTKRTCMVIIEVPAPGGLQAVAVVVEGLIAVQDIPATQIEPAPSFGIRIESQFLQGIARIDGRFVTLLDVDRLLTPEELGRLSEWVEHAQPEPAAAAVGSAQ